MQSSWPDSWRRLPHALVANNDEVWYAEYPKDGQVQVEMSVMSEMVSGCNLIDLWLMFTVMYRCVLAN